MSHFTHMKTCFQNLYYLEKALNRLNIIHKKQDNNITKSHLRTDNVNLIISQSNGYDIEFKYNGKEYELIADMSFWKQPYPIKSFVDKIAQEYAGEVIISESQKTGFQPTHYKQNKDGSNILILERWNNEKIIKSV